MSETANLTLPLLQAAQAQKHVTVNEALIRLDALVQLRLAGVNVAAPPLDAVDGQAFGIAGGATGSWTGQAGRIAIADNGGWVFATPRAGWRAWVIDAGAEVLFDGAGWVPVPGASGVSPSGAGLALRVVEFDHVLSAGGAQFTTGTIPSHAMVFGVTARVVDPVTGTLTDWSLGNEGASDRFGAGLGLAFGSYARGVLGSPMTFYSETPLLLTPEGGVFESGTVRVAVHYAELALPGTD